MRNSVACTLSLVALLLLQSVSLTVGVAEAMAATDILTVYTELQRFVGNDTGAGSIFADSVDFDGDTIVVGDTGAEAAYVFIFDADGNVTQQAKLVAADGAVGDAFGTSVAVSGDTIVVGAVFTTGLKGAIYVFERSGTSWDAGTKLAGADIGVSDNFGFAVDIEDDTIVAGAPNHDLTPLLGEDGAGYVFSRASSTAAWTQDAKIVAGDFATGDQFGMSAAIGGGRIVIGATGDDAAKGAVYLFSGAGWAQEAKLVGTDTVAGDELGTDVDISSGMVVAGAPFASPGGSMEGAAYVFSSGARQGGNAAWAQDGKLTADDGVGLDNFGISVAIDGSFAIVGADADDDKGAESGSAYVFERDSGFARAAKATNWNQIDKLIAENDGATLERFGNDVAIQGAYALVAAFAAAPAGAAYLFADEAALACGYLINPTSIAAGGSSTTKTISVSTSGACTWQATSSASWVNFLVNGVGSGITSGTGPTNVSVKVGRNDTGAGRTATLTFTGEDSFTQTITVSQGTGTAITSFLRVLPDEVVIPRQRSSSWVHQIESSGPHNLVIGEKIFYFVNYGPTHLALAATKNPGDAPRIATLSVCLDAAPAVCDTVTVIQAGSVPPTTRYYQVPPPATPRAGASAAVAVLGNEPDSRRRGMAVQAYDGNGDRVWNIALSELSGTAALATGDLNGDGDDEIVVAGIDASGTPVMFVRGPSGEPRGSASAGTTGAASATPMVLRRSEGNYLALGIAGDDGSGTVEIWRYGGTGRDGERGRFDQVASYAAAPAKSSDHTFKVADLDGDGDQEVFVGYASLHGKGAWFQIVDPEVGSAGEIEVARKSFRDVEWLLYEFRDDTPGTEVLAGLYDADLGRGEVRLSRGDGTRLLRAQVTPKKSTTPAWVAVKAPTGARNGGVYRLATAYVAAGSRPQVRLYSLNRKKAKLENSGKLDRDQELAALAAGNYDGDESNGDELGLLLTQVSRTVEVLFLSQDGTVLGNTEAFEARYFDPGILPMEILKAGRDEAVLLGRTIDGKPQVAIVSVDGTVQTRINVLTRNVQ